MDSKRAIQGNRAEALRSAFSNEKGIQLPSRPSLQTALRGSEIELEHQEGQTLLGSGASEQSPTQNNSAEEEKGRKFGPADRSCDFFWPLSIRPFDLCARTPRPHSFTSTGTSRPFHHINFLGQKIFVRSATPPEVSYWAAFLSTYTKPHRTFSRKGVIVAQANKFIDPFRYIPNGSEDAMEELCGSALVAALDGRVKKAYPNAGTWLEEREEDGDEAPICFDRQSLKTEPIYYSSTVPNNQLVLPHKMNERDQHDLVINGPRNFTPQASRTYKNVARKHVRRSSGLRKIGVSEEQEDLVDEVNAWKFDHSQRRYANFAATASRLSSVTETGDRDMGGPVEVDSNPNPTGAKSECSSFTEAGDRDMGGPVEVDSNPNPTGAKSECSVGQSGVELRAEELAVVPRGLEVLGMQEDSDPSDSAEKDFYDDEYIGFSDEDEDEDSPPCARERDISIQHVGYPASDDFTAVDNFPPMQVHPGPVGPSQPVVERADNCPPADAMHDFSEEGDVSLQRHLHHGADFVIHHPLPSTDFDTQYNSSLRFENNTILDSSEDRIALQNTTSASPIQQQEHFLPSNKSDVETAVHETSDERYASYLNLIEQRPQRSHSLATDGRHTILDSLEDGTVLQNASANPIEQENFLPSNKSDVETAVHETSDERYASYLNLIEQREQRPQRSHSLATDDRQTLSSLRSAIGSFFPHLNYSEERIGRIQHWVHQQQQQQQESIRPKLEGKHKLGLLKDIIEERKAAAMLTASSSERVSWGERDINRGAGYHSKRSTIWKKDTSYLDHPVGGVIWFLFLFFCFLYVWELLP